MTFQSNFGTRIMLALSFVLYDFGAVYILDQQLKWLWISGQSFKTQFVGKNGMGQKSLLVASMM